MKTIRYPIFRDFNQTGQPIGFVELNEDTVFMPTDVLSPEVFLGSRDGESGPAAQLQSFGLINGKNYLKNPEKKYSEDFDAIKDKNANHE